MILDMVVIADNIDFQVTDSVLEALILESNLIKKHQPKYNTKEKDNKSFNYVCITNEETPKVLIVRGRGIILEKYKEVFGPFPNGSQLKEAMKIIRRIFPFIDDQSSKKNNKIFYEQLGLTPNINVFSNGQKKSSFSSWSGSSSSLIRGPEEKKLFSDRYDEYKNNIKNIKLLFRGKKKSLIKNLKIKMAAFSKLKNFENAAIVRDQIFSLNHINDISLIKDEISFSQIKSQNFRIEAYDIAHMGGDNMVGVMVVVDNGEISKQEYKKFIIQSQENANDTGALEEVLSRRLRHTRPNGSSGRAEWGLPSLVVVDGGIAQKNTAERVLKRYQFKIPVVGVVKDDKHKAKAIIGDEQIIKKYKKSILLANFESHRFAIAFHKKRRNKNFLL
jgi:excinuclease ABC subunit C